MGRKKSYIQIWGALLCGACLAAGLLTGCGKSTDDDGATAKKTKITVGCDDFAPFSYMDGDGNMTGIDVELGEEAFRRMGYQAEFTIINWEEKKTLLESGAIDCIWSSFSMDGREEEYRWSGPYMRSHQVVAVNVDSDIHSLKDLKDKVIAVQSTTKPEEMIRSHHEA